MFINILLPVYNEEMRLEKGVKDTIRYFESINYTGYILTIVDNGSTDKTANIAEMLKKTYEQVHYLRLGEKGVGIAIRRGVLQNCCDIVGYMDIDLSTDIQHLRDVIDIFEEESDVAVVNGSRLNKNSKTIGRKWYRNVTSHGLTIILKIFLKMKATDSICGFKFFRKLVVENLINESGDEKGWFFIIELILRAERKNYKIRELPVRWQDDYNTTVHVWKLIREYLKSIWKLRRQFKKENIL